MTTIKRYTKSFVHYLRNNRAVSALEYALLAGVTAAGVGVAVTNFTDEITGAMGKMESLVKGISAPTTPTLTVDTTDQ